MEDLIRSRLSTLACTTQSSGGEKVVTQLRCDACAKFQANIATRRNYSDKWISGTEFVRTSNIRDHCKSDQHSHAMNLLKRNHARQSGSGTASYAPIAKALNKISDSEKEQLRHKLNIAFFTTKEKLSSIRSLSWSSHWKHIYK